MASLKWLRSLRSSVAALVVIVTCGLLLSTRQLYFSSNVVRRTPAELIHVCLCSDDTDLRPAAVAIKSAWSSALEPERLVFHYVTTPEFATLFQELFQRHLPGIRVEVHHNAALQARIQSFISFRETSKARKSLASPFNFAPFYLGEYIAGDAGGTPDLRRVIYIDTDTVLLGDVAELHEMDLQDHSSAAVKYCWQHWNDYINFGMLTELGYSHFNPKQCIANRGVMVLDLPRWKLANMTGKIEHFMQLYRTAREDLWVGGMSQPPWLLAMNGDYFNLGDAWNCNGLGRESMAPLETQTLRKAGFDRQALKTLGASLVTGGSVVPYVVMCSSTGKLLHFNGAMKPWLPERFTGPWPPCSMPLGLAAEQHWVWQRTVRVFCEPMKFVSCAELWSRYITEDAACALKDFDKEWGEELEKWNIPEDESVQKDDGA